MKQLFTCLFLFTMTLISCQPPTEKEAATVRLVTLDPGHFHAALVQKSMYEGVDSVVHVYAPPGADVELHLGRISAFNNRTENPTHWQEVVYTGADFFEKMLEEKTGNVVVLSGNNRKKTESILQAVKSGFHVLADKPMVIDTDDFRVLNEAFAEAEKNNLLLYDIMTERYEITSMLQRALSMQPEIFGTLEKGSPDNPAVVKESVHHFYKYVSGQVLTRPAWFMDVSQQGEGIVDVTTHLVDLIQWACFPDEAIDYTKDIEVDAARRWTTDMTRSEFGAITKLADFPDYLKKDVVNDTLLKVYSNGEIDYRLRGVHARVAVTWAYKAPEGAGDTHYSIMRGTKANLVIRQGAEQQYKPALYIEPVAGGPAYAGALTEAFKNVEAMYPGITLAKTDRGWEVVIPDHYKEGHEAHFSRVTEKFLEYLRNGRMPAWEVPNMIAKYYITTRALEIASE